MINSVAKYYYLEQKIIKYKKNYLDLYIIYTISYFHDMFLLKLLRFPIGK